ncbi:MAG TPA: GvpL/GvpF family gas vesicle protein [Thermoanaerobaculia bacterium]|nr:GvpL/GvpF family gas vesicle protein [Thermoanaerobaculia bacterium]
MLYVYAISREPVLPEGEAIDSSDRFGATGHDGVCAIFTPVSADEFSQDVIDRRAGDLEWLGAIGYRHQAVMSQLMKRTTIIPLRAFTLFSGEGAVRTYLDENRELLDKTLARLAGRQEWTLRVELDPPKWADSLEKRVESLRALQDEIANAAPGKAFLLRKKMDEAKKKASHTAEDSLVGEIESAVLEKLRCETVAESRQRREGAFPQINVLVNRDEESVLHELHAELSARYEPEGVTIALLGPWPPYTFAGPGGRAQG